MCTLKVFIFFLFFECLGTNGFAASQRGWELECSTKDGLGMEIGRNPWCKGKHLLMNHDDDAFRIPRGKQEVYHNFDDILKYW